TQCQYCQAEIKRLKALLENPEKYIKSEQRQKDSAITALLRLHFAYIGMPVRCCTVKPFLPSLANPALQIRIPTPIAVHLDKCQDCSNDLQTIIDLHLSHKQLCRLSLFLAEKPAEDAVSCTEAQAAILFVVLMNFRETNAEVLKHLYTCPDCRKSLYEYRESVRMDLLRNGEAQKEFPCEAVSSADIFDYCFPYGIDPAANQYAKFRESLTSHLRSCPTCLAKMQQLHNTISGIAERADSGVVTCFTLKEQTETAVESEPDGVYANWPINVQVFDNCDAASIAPTRPAFPQKLRQKVPALNLKQFVKPAIAAAAVILIALAVFFSMPAAKAVDLSQIYQALEKVKNICILSFAPGRKEPIQEQWISRTDGFRLLLDNKRADLWDFENRMRKTKPLDTGITEITTLSADSIANGKKSLEGSFGLLPFSDISVVPKDAQWNRVDNKDIAAIIPGTEVYDLIWTEKGATSFVFRKWRVFVDTHTNLPKRAEWYSKFKPDEEYRVERFTMVTYPTNGEIQAIIQSTFD
ncbi:MAG: hypothetical protein NTX52_12025, partial [Planctomycetota bacterium]|nr:hypothetical protein [Planctomycetota bacterium]